MSLCFEAVVLCRCVWLCLVPSGYLSGVAVACEGSAGSLQPVDLRASVSHLQIDAWLVSAL